MQRLIVLAVLCFVTAVHAAPVRVVVWNEENPAQKKAYPDFLGTQIAAYLRFGIPHPEVYSEPFHVPQPDAVIFREISTKGEKFRAGMVWNVGRGKVFYFSPGHETYPIYFQPAPLKIIGNAVEWLGGQNP